MRILAFFLSVLLFCQSAPIYADYSCLAPKSLAREYEYSFEKLSRSFLQEVRGQLRSIGVIDSAKKLSLDDLADVMDLVYRGGRYDSLRELITPLDVIDLLNNNEFKADSILKKEYSYYIKGFYPLDLSPKEFFKGDQQIFAELERIAVKGDKPLCIGGITAHGKSTFTKDFTFYMHKKGYKVLLISSSDYFRTPLRSLVYMSLQFILSLFPFAYVSPPLSFQMEKTRNFMQTLEKWYKTKGVGKVLKLKGAFSVVKNSQLELKNEALIDEKTIILLEGKNWIEPLKQYRLPLTKIIIRPNLFTVSSKRAYERSQADHQESKTFMRVVDGELKSHQVMKDFPFKKQIMDLMFQFTEFSYFKRVFWPDNKETTDYILVNNDFENRSLFKNRSFIDLEKRWPKILNPLQSILLRVARKIDSAV